MILSEGVQQYDIFRNADTFTHYFSGRVVQLRYIVKTPAQKNDFK